MGQQLLKQLVTLREDPERGPGVTDGLLEVDDDSAEALAGQGPLGGGDSHLVQGELEGGINWL